MSAALFCTAAIVTAGAVALRKRAKALPPRAARIPHIVSLGAVAGEQRGPRAMVPPVLLQDDLFWLRDDARTAPAVLEHVTAENSFTSYVTAPLKPAIDALYAEMLSRIQETDADMPYTHGPYTYVTRTKAGSSYVIHSRAPAAPIAPMAAGEPPLLDGERVYLDENELAAGKPMCDVHAVVPSPCHRFIAFSVDYTGGETYDIRVKDTLAVEDSVSRDGMLDDVLSETSGSVVWGADATTLYYLTMDAQHRPNKLWRHVLGRPQSTDECLLTEDDEMFWIDMDRTRTGDLIIVTTSSKTSSEAHYIPLRGPDTRPVLIAARRKDVLYDADHYVGSGGGTGVLVIRTNDGVRPGAAKAINFQIVTTSLASPGAEHWTPIVAPSADISFDGVSIFRHFWAIWGRADGSPALWTLAGSEIDAFLEDGGAQIAEGSPCAVTMTRLPTNEAVCDVASARGNAEYDARVLRYCYSSPRTPTQTQELAVPLRTPAVAASAATGDWKGRVVLGDLGASRILKQKSAPNTDPTAYASRRIFVSVRDGVRVPVSIVWRPSAHGQSVDAASFDATGDINSCPLASPAPLLLYGYGSYGHSIDIGFSSSVLSLVDRGIVYAVAHVRGGGEMGRRWYEEQGKLLTKRNTFNDFLDVAAYLSTSGWTAPGRIATMGASAGGLLMGNVLNFAPDGLIRAVVSQVGFVDVLVSMCDPSIPLTVTEWEEWGNPNESEYYEYVRSYSPMENVTPRPYPATLLTAGINDRCALQPRYRGFCEPCNAYDVSATQQCLV